MGSHSGTHLHSVLEGRGLYDSLSSDIIGCTMCTGYDWTWKSTCNCDSLLEALKLEGNLSLIVIHCYNSIEVTAESLDECDV